MTVEAAGILRHLKTAVLNSREAVMTSEFKGDEKSLQNSLVMPMKGPMWSTRWAQRVDLEHRDTSPWQEIARRLAPPAVHS